MRRRLLKGKLERGEGGGGGRGVGGGGGGGGTRRGGATEGLVREKMRQVEKYGGHKEIDDSLDKRWSWFGSLADPAY